MLTTETQANLRKFHEMALKELNAWLMQEGDKLWQHEPTRPDIDDLNDDFIKKQYEVTAKCLVFALGDYTIGEPEREREGCITAPMACGRMNGIIMFRDNEVTAHT